MAALIDISDLDNERELAKHNKLCELCTWQCVCALPVYGDCPFFERIGYAHACLYGFGSCDCCIWQGSCHMHNVTIDWGTCDDYYDGGDFTLST